MALETFKNLKFTMKAANKTYETFCMTLME